MFYRYDTYFRWGQQTVMRVKQTRERKHKVYTTPLQLHVDWLVMKAGPSDITWNIQYIWKTKSKSEKKQTLNIFHCTNHRRIAFTIPHNIFFSFQTLMFVSSLLYITHGALTITIYCNDSRLLIIISLMNMKSWFTKWSFGGRILWKAEFNFYCVDNNSVDTRL